MGIITKRARKGSQPSLPLPQVDEHILSSNSEAAERMITSSTEAVHKVSGGRVDENAEVEVLMENALEEMYEEASVARGTAETVNVNNASPQECATGLVETCSSMLKSIEKTITELSKMVDLRRQIVVYILSYRRFNKNYVLAHLPAIVNTIGKYLF